MSGGCHVWQGPPSRRAYFWQLTSLGESAKRNRNGSSLDVHEMTPCVTAHPIWISAACANHGSRVINGLWVRYGKWWPRDILWPRVPWYATSCVVLATWCPTLLYSASTDLRCLVEASVASTVLRLCQSWLRETNPPALTEVRDCSTVEASTDDIIPKSWRPV